MKKILIFNPSRFKVAPEFYFYTLTRSLIEFKNDIIKVECNEDNYKEIILRHRDIDAIFLPRCYGSDILQPYFKNINVLKIVQMDDLHYFDSKTREKLHKNFDFADIILLPYYYHFIKNPEFSKYKDKAFYFPFAAADEILAIKPENAPINKIFLSGATSKYYSLRNIIRDHAASCKEIDFLPHPGYFELKHNIIGIKYYHHISKYIAAISTSADKPLDYPVMKYFEIPACNVIPIFENISYLKDLGFENGKSFIEVNKKNYKEVLRSEYLSDKDSIRQTANNLLKKHHLISNRVEFFYKIVKAGKGFNWSL